MRTGRSIRGFCLPPHCSRGERRAIEKLAVEGRGPRPGPPCLVYPAPEPPRRSSLQTRSGFPRDRSPAPRRQRPRPGEVPTSDRHQERVDWAPLRAGRTRGGGGRVPAAGPLSEPPLSPVEPGGRPGRQVLRAQEHDGGGAAAAHRRPLPLRQARVAPAAGLGHGPGLAGRPRHLVRALPTPPRASPSAPPRARPRLGGREGPRSWVPCAAAQASSQVTLSAQVSRGAGLVEASPSLDLGGGGQIVLASRFHPLLGPGACFLSHSLPGPHPLRRDSLSGAG